MSNAVQRRRGTTAQHSTFTGLVGELTVDTSKKTVVVHDGATAGGFPLARHNFVTGTMFKPDPSTVAFSKTGAGTVSVKTGHIFEINGVLVQTTSATAINMPTLTSGTDYAVYVCDDGTFRADSNFSNPTGYTTTNSKKIGGFHYAPGDNASAQSGGNTTPNINAYSLWDNKFKPACADPRGMALVANWFWADIYLLNTSHITNGTSKYNATIADGSSPPLIPTLFGGTGSNSYGDLTWYTASEVLSAYGKRLPSQQEFAALAYGTTEGSSIGTDQGSTVWNAAYVSKFGINQVAGVMWQWANELAGPYAAAGWTSNTGGRGQTYNIPNAAIFGGSWVSGANCGSRASLWNSAPSASNNDVGCRGVCDHLILV